MAMTFGLFVPDVTASTTAKKNTLQKVTSKEIQTNVQKLKSLKNDANYQNRPSFAFLNEVHPSAKCQNKKISTVFFDRNKELKKKINDRSFYSWDLKVMSQLERIYSFQQIVKDLSFKLEAYKGKTPKKMSDLICALKNLDQYRVTEKNYEDIVQAVHEALSVGRRCLLASLKNPRGGELFNLFNNYWNRTFYDWLYLKDFWKGEVVNDYPKIQTLQTRYKKMEKLKSKNTAIQEKFPVEKVRFFKKLYVSSSLNDLENVCGVTETALSDQIGKRYGYGYFLNRKWRQTFDAIHKKKINGFYYNKHNLTFDKLPNNYESNYERQIKMILAQLEYLAQERNASGRERKSNEHLHRDYKKNQLCISNRELLAKNLLKLSNCAYQMKVPLYGEPILYSENGLDQKKIKKFGNSKADICTVQSKIESIFSALKEKLDITQSDGKLALWIFSDPGNPGGGVLNGQFAQEESISRWSALLPALAQKNMMETYWNHQSRHETYSPETVYLNDVLCLDALKEDFYRADLILAAMPNCSRTGYHGRDRKRVQKTIENVFVSAILNGVTDLVIGPAGTGVFKIPADDVISMLAYYCVLYRKHFKSIVFCDMSQKYFNQFMMKVDAQKRNLHKPW